ncbi:MAG: 2-phosphosulfolactate phosphatase, partial [Aureliella sp.]
MTLPNKTIRQLWVALLPSDAAKILLQDDTTQQLSTAVVIDTLRFTTTANQALALGARSVRVSSTVEQAFQLAHESPGRPLL